MTGAWGPTHWIILIAVFVLLFGARKLPDAARSLGKSMRIFKSEIKEMQAESEPSAPTPITSERVDTPVAQPQSTDAADKHPA